MSFLSAPSRLVSFLGIVIKEMFSAVSDLLLRRKLHERGKRTMATVVNVKISGRRGHSRIYTLEYMAENERQTGECKTSWELTGDTAEIAYLPEDPKRFMLAELLPNSFRNIAHFVVNIAVRVLALILLAYMSYAFFTFVRSGDLTRMFRMSSRLNPF